MLPGRQVVQATSNGTRKTPRATPKIKSRLYAKRILKGETMIRVLVNGAFGRMGLVTQAAIKQQTDLELVGSIGKTDNLEDSIKKAKADVVIDFTLPHTVFNNTETIIKVGARPVIGTSGLNPDQIKTLSQQCEQKKLGAIIAPNFSVGAVLMMRYAADAIKYFPHAEIIEMHHDKKVDSPSGTAAKTAQLMAANRENAETINHDTPARGHAEQNIPIHSVRLPGLFAHQMVIFGGNGETLTIRHDSTDRDSMMPGVCMACRKVVELDHLVYGLENIL